MKVELSHDILARKVYDKASSEDKLILKIEQLIRSNFNRYKERHVLMSKDDIEYIDSFLDQVHISEEQKQFIKKSQDVINARRRNIRFMWIAIFAALTGIAIVAVWQSINATKQQTIAEEQRSRAEEKTEEALELRVLAEGKTEEAKRSAEEALKLKDKAVLAEKKAAAQRDEIKIALEEVQRQKEEADRQRIAADSAKAETERQQIIAVIAKDKAIAAQDTAIAAQNKAIAAQKEANEQKERAIKSDQKTKELYQIARARAKSSRAIRLIRGGKIKDGVELALSAHDTVMRYAPDQQNIDDHAALQIALEELQENKRANMFNDHKEAIRSIAHHPTQSLIASADESGKILVWNYTKRQLVTEIAPPSNIKRRIRTLTFSNNGKQIVGGTTDGILLSWDYEGIKTSDKADILIDTLYGIVEHIDFPHQKNKEYLGVFTVKDKLYIFDTKNKELAIKQFKAPISAFKLSYFGQFIIVAVGDIIYQYSLDYKKPVDKMLVETFRRQETELRHVTALSIHSLSGKIAIGNQYGTVWLVSLNDFINDQNALKTDGKTAGETEHRSRITGLDFNSTGTLLVSSSLDKTAKIWDATNLKTERLSLYGHIHWLWGTVFIQEQSKEQILTYGEDKTIRIWETNTKTLADKVELAFEKYKKQHKSGE